MIQSLFSKVALVTGASRGLGRGIALALGAQGAKVYVTARPRSGSEVEGIGDLEAVAAEIDMLGGQGIACPCDQGNDNQITALIRRIEDADGALDILVNNAFPVPDLQPLLGRKFWEVPIDAWRPVIDVGLRSHYVVSSLAVPLLRVRCGIIINISSAAGQIYFGSVVYGMGKAGMDRMATDMAIELEGTGVTAVSLWPGIVRTEVIEASFAERGQDLVVDLLSRATAHFERSPWVGVRGDDLWDALESPAFTGRAVVALAQDPNVVVRSGHILAVALLADEYDFRDIDERRPDAFCFHHRPYWPALHRGHPVSLRAAVDDGRVIPE